MAKTISSAKKSASKIPETKPVAKKRPLKTAGKLSASGVASAKKSVASSAKAVVKAVSAKDKKVVREVIKDSHMGGFVNFIREQGVVGILNHYQYQRLAQINNYRQLPTEKINAPLFAREMRLYVFPNSVRNIVSSMCIHSPPLPKQVFICRRKL